MAVTLDSGWTDVNGVLSEGDLHFTSLDCDPPSNIRATEGKTSGKWYWEVECTLAVCGEGWSEIACVVRDDALVGELWDYPWGEVNTDKWGFYTGCSFGGFFGTENSTIDDAPDGYVQGDIIGVALDIDNGKIWFSKNGVWQASGGDSNSCPGAGSSPNPTTGNDPALVFTPGEYAWYAATRCTSDTACRFNFGGSDFSYTKPAGFLNYDLNTDDLNTDDVSWDAPSAGSGCDAPYIDSADSDKIIADYDNCTGSISQDCGTVAVTSALQPTTGKWYFELAGSSNLTALDCGSLAYNVTYGLPGAYVNATDYPHLCVAFDADASIAWVKTPTGEWDGDPEAGTGGTTVSSFTPTVVFSALDNGAYPAWPCTIQCANQGGSFSGIITREVIGYWGNTSFSGDVPSGFSPLYNNTGRSEQEAPLSAAIGFGDTVNCNDAFDKEITEGLGFSEYAEAPYPVDLETSDGVKFGDQILVDTPFECVVSEGLSFGEESDTDPYVVIEEGLSFGDSAVESGSGITSEDLGFNDAISATAVNTITVSDIDISLTISEAYLDVSSVVVTCESDIELPALEVVAYSGATADIELPTLTMEATASRSVFASGDVELPSLVVSATSGSNASVELPAIEVSAEGSISVVATASITLPMMTMSAKAVLSEAITLPSLEVDATAVLGNLLTGDVTLPALTLSGSFLRGVTANADIKLPKLSMSASADRGNFLSADLTLPLITIEAEGYSGISSRASCSIPVLTLLGSFYCDITSDASFSLPTLELLANLDNPGQYDSYTLEHERGRSECI
jgi:hypothetical protein